MLFNRSIKLTIGTGITGLELEGFRIAFEIEKNLKPEPNTAEIIVYNLNEDHRKLLEDSEKIPVQLIAGYDGQDAQIFFGNLRRAYTEYDGTDFTTTITSGDGEKEKQKVKIDKSFPPKTPVSTVIREIATSLGIGTGNLELAIATARLSGTGATLIPGGMTFTGNASRELTALLSACGLEWSVQDGEFQILTLNQFLIGDAIILAPQTGLIGSPSVDNEGVLSAVSLLIPGLAPGKIIIIQSRFVTGQFRIEAIGYSGDTHGNDWIADIEAKRY